MRLAEISQGWQAVEQALEANDGEITPEIAATLDALNFAEKEKIDGTVFYIRALEGECESLKQVEEEIAAKRSQRLRRIEWLKARVRVYMQERQVTTLPGEIFRFALVKSGKPPVEVLVPVESLPEEWVTRTVVPDKEAIRRDLAMGATWREYDNGMPGKALARLGEPTTSLRIF